MSAAYGRGVLGAEQVGPPDRPDQQRAAGQQQERLVGARRVGDRIADVLGRVPGRVERPEAEGPDVERLAVADRPVLVRELGAGADDVGRTGQRGELAAARDVVVVEMGLDDVADPQAGRPRRLEVDVDVAPRVDDRGGARRLIGDERRQMAEPLDPVLGDTHGGSLYRAPGLNVRWRLTRSITQGQAHRLEREDGADTEHIGPSEATDTVTECVLLVTSLFQHVPHRSSRSSLRAR